MIITYHGIGSVKVSFGDTTVGINPVSKDSKEKATRFGADVGLVSLNHPDMNGLDGLSHGDRNPFEITGPGEYEVHGVFIKGYQSVSHYGGEERVNTIYMVTLEGMNLCFLGALGSTELDPKVLEALDDIDILFVPIGNNGVLDPSGAYTFAVKLGANMIIPTHYDKDTLKQFLKEGGNEKANAEDKLTVKKKDVDLAESAIKVLNQA